MGFKVWGGFWVSVCFVEAFKSLRITEFVEDV